jgi:predicted DNA-binding transcriptional regulator YafY
LHALELGMAMLRLESPPEEQGTIDQARDRLRRAIAGLTSDSADEATYAASTGTKTDERRAMRKELEECIAARCVADLCYQSAHAAKAEWRRVRPLGFVLSRGVWFLIAFTMGADEIRVFRFDRISEMRNTQEKFVAPESFSLDDVVRDGRVLSTESGETLRIRYSPRIARWIAEREGLSLDADGSVTAQMPLLDTEWAARYALQYGTEAEVIAPDTVRLALRDRLQQLS